MTRFAKNQRVFFIEEPVEDDKEGYDLSVKDQNLSVVTFHVRRNWDDQLKIEKQKKFLSSLFIDMKVDKYLLWYYTPMALSISDQLVPQLVIYDCMDELSNFLFAPPSMKEFEKNLLNKADIVFTGGYSLFKARNDHYGNKVRLFPSSIDAAHFHVARTSTRVMPDQATIPSPRIGFCGVIDERMNIQLLEQIALKRPDWHFVMVGPVVKIDPGSLPNLPNIHYLGMKAYDELPFYFAGWNAAIMPFALNEATRYISPTKTPEYLAAGLPVISTSIPDVAATYGKEKVIQIADTAEDFIDSIEKELNRTDKQNWLERIDRILSQTSWDKTYSSMKEIIDNKLGYTNQINLVEPIQATQNV